MIEADNREDKKIPRHIKYDFYEKGLDGTIKGNEVNEIIEEIMLLLISKKVTVELAIQILEDTISSIKKETLLEKRIIDKKIT